MTVPDLDHTSFAVHDALAWAGRLRRELGATPIAGETLAEFRYLLLYVGDATDGARIELLEPRGAGFLSRFLERHGIGPHHITFTVPDLRAAVERVRAVGATVVGEDYEHPSWQEAFVAPDGIHGVVIQLAQSDTDYPGPAELLASTDRDPALFPSSRGATDPLWWTPVWESPVRSTARLGTTHLASTDPAYSRRLFGDALGGRLDERPDGLHFAWPNGSVRVHAASRPGVTAMTLDGGPPDGIALGPCRLRQEPGRQVADLGRS